MTVRASLSLLELAIDNHGLEEIAISYNGGKDCLVMLILLMATIHRKFCTNQSPTAATADLPVDYKLDSIFVNSEEPFPQLLEFIKSSTHYYHLNPIIIQLSLKEGFEEYLHSTNNKIKAIVVGIRYADPYGSSLSPEQMTDHDWPSFLRIHPILPWNYIDIWDFLVGCNLDYCEMYDQGYTSLGGIHTTIPNPYLKLKEEGDDVHYAPAYMLIENADERERVGRIKR
ncbi:3'-phosphoadenosine 5'-phosphosulfate sulfotransferase [Scheffersomyces spartinae]|uniref:FAD synthase n=1 Tax=Scheffersomyces spartinae TaxID=45513 RepID=A0A9P8AGI6_9ASCO|nr:3'-phosphoadenosine 5'-phosphosulfate sulfotransferase [Scheffersomyces spartinae]KAG7192400.1 3'-phosphoadenosine 5'-phosphosulfate sulfotransferase [Scheffersomyces spartinae]